MNIIIVGAGEIGRHLAFSLSDEAHNITVFEADETRAAELDDKIDARVLPGDGSSASVLIEAGVGECDLFFALTSHNNTNLVASSVAKSLGAKTTICRVHPELQRDEWLFDHRGHFGIDHLFSSERLSAVELAKHIRHPDSLMVEEIARGRIELQQVIVESGSDVAGKTLVELSLPARVRVGMVRRGTDRIIPGGSDTLNPGDLVTLFGEPRKLTDTVARFGRRESRHDKSNVVIFGGGEYGFSLAQMLESCNCKVRIFDRDPGVCEELTHRLTGTTVINADATSLDELREEQVGDADFFVATTQSDEDNVMTCLQAHNLGTDNCLTLIHRADYADAISHSGTKFGVLAAVSPREASRQELLRFITSDRYHQVKKLDGAEIIEASVREGSKAAGKKISEIKWPQGTLLVALVHGIHATVPTADESINAGDNIYALVTDSTKRKLLKLL
ncbi:MAG: Trk system potassium transporter TrkA [Verrucomicrobiales bacterium]|nr:Trk system potassium transporter TrkA [Verrucomicrobiales bacterium]